MGVAIGSGCGGYVGGGAGVLVFAIAVLGTVSWIFWHGAIQQGFVRFERISWAESKASFHEAWTHRNDHGVMGWLAAVQVRVSSPPFPRADSEMFRVLMCYVLLS
eukprot:817040-Rhodomonas_salina.1